MSNEAGHRLPSPSFVDSKIKSIVGLLNHQWTDDDITSKMKRAGLLRNKYASINRDSLMTERAQAIKTGKESEVARIDAELAKLDGPKPVHNHVTSSPAAKPAAPKQPTQQERLAALNLANRQANQEAIRKAQIREKREHVKLQEKIRRGEAVANRFARVKTKARTVFDDDENDSSSLQVPKGDDLFGDGTDGSRAATPAAGDKNGATPRGGTPVAKVERKIGPGGFRKRNMDDEVIGAMDLGIDIDI